MDPQTPVSKAPFPQDELYGGWIPGGYEDRSKKAKKYLVRLFSDSILFSQPP